jgi:streptomycin 6-kinase
LLHGDLHYDNVLSSSRAGYLLIDPKGVSGDPAFDVGYLVSRPAPTARDSLPLAEAIGRRLSFLPDALGVDRRRTRAFAYVAAALSAAWAREDEDPGEKLYVEAMQILEPYI